MPADRSDAACTVAGVRHPQQDRKWRVGSQNDANDPERIFGQRTAMFLNRSKSRYFSWACGYSPVRPLVAYSKYAVACFASEFTFVH